MGGSITLGHGGAGFGVEYPPTCAAKVLKSDATKFSCPAVLHHHYPPISHRLRTCPPRRRGSSGWAWCWVSCADALSFGGTGSRPSPGTRERGSRFQRCIVDAPYGVGVGVGRRDETLLGPDFRREERGEELVLVGGVDTGLCGVGASVMRLLALKRAYSQPEVIHRVGERG